VLGVLEHDLVPNNRKANYRMFQEIAMNILAATGVYLTRILLQSAVLCAVTSCGAPVRIAKRVLRSELCREILNVCGEESAEIVDGRKGKKSKLYLFFYLNILAFFSFERTVMCVFCFP
jgi:predicted nucleic acid-binding Zn ribbon protein